MAQVLHMDTSFPGKINSTGPTSLHTKDTEAPYSVETPYGYRLDLDFLKYVNDIEKGNTIKRVPVQRRPRYGSLPRGYGYTGSWWTSTESLCSNASMDSRHSSYSYCAPGYHTSQRPNFSTARVEKTLLDARRKLEEEKDKRFSNLGSMHSSVAGSNTSLSSAHSFNRAQGGGSSYTPVSSGLSTPVSPTPAHLQHVREQMAMALRKIRDLEEQVKTIPVLQVKISVLQEEKRQLSVQLKSQKFLGHTLGFNRGRTRGELYIDIPEEEVEANTNKMKDTCHVGVGVREEDLGFLPETEVLKTKVGQLEVQLRKTMHELQSAQMQIDTVKEERQGGTLQADHAVRATSLGWQEQQDVGAAGLHTMVSYTQQCQEKQQRTVGIQVYTLEQPTLVLRSQQCSTSSRPLSAPLLKDTPHRGYAKPLNAEESTAVTAKQVREVLRSELSTSVSITSPSSGAETNYSQAAPLCQRLKDGEQKQQLAKEVLHSHGSAPQPASPQSSLRSIMKHKADREPCPSSIQKNLQFTGVNGGYESTSTESTSETSDDESDVSEYHEATEKLPESPAHHPQATFVSSSAVSVTVIPESTETVNDQHSNVPLLLSEGSGELSDNFMTALYTLKKALGEPNAFSQQGARTAYTTVLQEWLRVSCHKSADTAVVRAYMDAFASVSPQLLEFVINMADGNGNTALHYTVSHSNFPVVKLLLDTADKIVCAFTGLCNADKQNKAGYTAIMLTALAAFHSESDLQTVLQLLRTGDVNAKASQAGQTALMLAVSHGRGDMVRALLCCGAQVNLQDDDGSTALMCACEHGHVDIVRQLLSVPGCDATLTDNDGSTALSIALEASQNDIAVLLYAHLNFAKPPSPVS
ncbi:hypothetical protein C0J50_7153, partial [Silurus asotus]